MHHTFLIETSGTDFWVSEKRINVGEETNSGNDQGPVVKKTICMGGTKGV